jgi:hypothetical protein
MIIRRVMFAFFACCCLGYGTACWAQHSVGGRKPVVVPANALHHPVLWTDPGPGAQLDLFAGPGGKAGIPSPPYTFEQEDRTARTPQFDARDVAGKRFTVEAGREAKPEVAASRLLWAAGYMADEDYLVRVARVNGLQMRNMKRYLHRDALWDTRFVRRVDGRSKLGIWLWKKNAFTGTRELNGMRVMLALLNCWDLRDENNLVVQDAATGNQEFRVSGLAASFGKARPRFLRRKAKDDPKSYARSNFITKRTETYVDFATPSRSFNPLALFSRGGSVWVGRNVPRKDAKWIGSILGQLSHLQIEDAFWAAGYTADEVNLFANVVDARIHALADL